MNIMKPGNLLKVLYVFGGERAQGAEIVIERLIAINADNVETHLILSPGQFADALLEKPKKYKVITLSALKKLNRSSTNKTKFYLKAIRNYLSVSFFVYKYVKKHNIDVIHANTLVPSSYLFPFIIYSRLFSIKKRFLWSDHDLNYFSGLDRSQSKLALRLYDHTLVVSEAVKRKYPDENKIIVLYNGLDPEIFKPDESKRRSFRSAIHADENDLVIGMAASISPDKGQLGLIEAFTKLNKEFLNIKLLLTGNFATDTPAYSKLLIEAVNSNDNITYLGHINRMVDFYNGCDIIVNNSNNFRSESLGTTIYEAMACEKVVVAANTGGTPEIISDGVDGFLFEAENVEDLYKTLKMVMLKFRSSDFLGQAARDKVKQKFSIDSMINIYNEILTVTKKSNL